MMRPLVMDFQNDTTAIRQSYQYMFGKSFLVAPITEPAIAEWPVYLPKGAAWYDFWTGRAFRGGQVIKTSAPQDKIPLFVKAGSIIPMGKNKQFTSEKPADTLEVRVYLGANAVFNLYEDERDNYNYEKGWYTVIPFQWDEKKHLLTIGAVQRSYPGYLKSRVFNIVFIQGKGDNTNEADEKKMVLYQGAKTVISQSKNRLN
jgi:alpha-D-xyloside xylohydrolase